jgi:hypothetical protein
VKGRVDNLAGLNLGRALDEFDVTAISLWDNKASSDTYNTNTYPEVLKTMASCDGSATGFPLERNRVVLAGWVMMPSARKETARLLVFCHPRSLLAAANSAPPFALDGDNHGRSIERSAGNGRSPAALGPVHGKDGGHP